MRAPTATFLVHGTDPPPVPPKRLCAGPLTLDYDQGDLRCVKLGEREIIRRIYGAVRDRNWGTVRGGISDLKLEISETAFRIRHTRTHRQDGIHFVWHAELTGEADGTLRFTFDGEAKSAFLRNRIGLCVLHPLRECAGARVRALLADGTGRELVFPEIIAREQPMRGFDGLAGLAHEIGPDVWAEVRLTGDVFETEDQRNWIDASYKTYGTPLARPFPVEVKAGTRIRQTAEVRLLGIRSGRGEEAHSSDAERGTRKPGSSRSLLRSAAPLRVEVPTDGWVRLPELGLGAASHGQAVNDGELSRLAALNIGHLRADVRLADAEWRVRFLNDARPADALGLPLELAVHLPADGEARELPELRPELTRLRAGVSRVLAFQEGQKTTTSMVLTAMREQLGDLGVPIGAGTDADLYQFNLQRPPADSDFLCWSMNPQVHARDTRSLMETPEAAAAQVASVKNYFPGAPLVVSPITLQRRCHPVATGDAAATAAGELPPSVDPRQMSLVGAAWTVAMLAAFAPSGVESLTFFETTGWRGVMEATPGSPLPEKFPSFAGGVFPLWHVFAALNGFRSVAVVPVGDPRQVTAFAVTNRVGRRRILLANLTAACVEVSVVPVGGTVWLLDEFNLADAMREPEAWWRRPAASTGAGLRISAFAVAFVDVS